jgi:hypothetical protein
LKEQPSAATELQLVISGLAHNPDTVGAGRHQKRPRWQVEDDEYDTCVRRILRAYSRRVRVGAVEALAVIPGLAEEIDPTITEDRPITPPVSA